MKKLILFLLILICVFSSVYAGKEMPDWLLEDSLSNEEWHYEWGSAKQTSLQLSIKRAKAAARDNMAEWVRTAVHEIITSYANEAGADDFPKQAIDAFETLSIQKAEAILSGCSQVDMWNDKNGEFDKPGTIYILLRIAVDNIKEQFYGALNDKSVQKEFKKSGAAKEANNMMNAAIDKYFSLPNSDKL